MKNRSRFLIAAQWFDYYPGNQQKFFLEVAFALRLKPVINY